MQELVRALRDSEHHDDWSQDNLAPDRQGEASEVISQRPGMPVRSERSREKCNDHSKGPHDQAMQNASEYVTNGGGDRRRPCLWPGSSYKDWGRLSML